MNLKFLAMAFLVVDAAAIAWLCTRGEDPILQATPAPVAQAPVVPGPAPSRNTVVHPPTAPVAAARPAAKPAPPAPKGMRSQVWKRALAAHQCALRRGQIKPGAALAIIDYDLPSSQKRLWLVDAKGQKVLLNEWVSHGSGSGQLVAEQFSNVEGSFQTSVGVYRGAEQYSGQHGASLRLDGLEKGFNDQARQRAIVVHAAWYAEPSMVAKTGRLGRSQGCPAVREQAIEPIRKALSDGGMLFAHASEDDWLQESTYLNCASA